jgi:predicted molibdopterin-dependent oxidoreductase YjgC
MAQRRIEKPLARESGKHKAIALEAALEKTVAALRAAARKHGAEAVGVFVSPELSNEEMHLAARIAREGIGTNNVASLSLLCAGTESGALDASFGFTASTADRSALRAADLIVCNNADTLNDHLILGVEVLGALRAGAKLIVAGSSGDALASLATLSLDPMRGRAALLWNGAMQVLLDRAFFDRDALRRLPGGEEFLSDLRDYGAKTIAERTGVEEPKIVAAADLLAAARKVVVIHSPDRPQDQSPGDVVALANLVLLLRSKGVRADILLPHVGANGAALEVVGADPAFLAGRRPAGGLPGAKSRQELLKMLQDGRLKAAIVLGEDPMRDDKTASYFGDVDFLAVVDWCQTETAQYADIVLPASTFLESDGTRINFEGRLTRYAPAVRAPGGVPTWSLLSKLAKAFEIQGVGGTFPEIASEVDLAARSGLGGGAKFAWNTGQARDWDGAGRLKVADVRTKPSPICPPLTASEQYKRQIREVGLEHFRVQGPGA